MHKKDHTIILSILLSVIVLTLSIKPAFPISWSSEITPLTEYDRFDGFPSITQASDGRIWVVWSRSVNGYRATYYETSSDMGYSWSNPRNLTKVPDVYENTKPAIIQTMDDSLWVVWTSNRPPPPPPPKPDFNMSASPDSLTIPQNSSDISTITVTSLYGFDETVNITVSGMPQDVNATLNPSQVTPPPNGTANSILTVSVGTTATLANYTLTVTGTSTGLPPKERNVDIALQITQMGSLSYTIHNYLAVAELATELSLYDYEIYYRTSSDNGDTWSKIVQLTKNSVDDLSPTILQLMNGTILIFYMQSHEIFYKYSSDGGETWVTTQLTDNSYTDSYPAAAQTRDGRIWVAWDSYRSSKYNVYYQVYDGSNWLGEEQLTSTSDVDSCPSILETVDGLIWVFWTHSEATVDATDDIYYSYTSDNGGSWSTPTQLTPVDTDNDSWPSAIQTRDSSIWVVWASNRTGNYEIFYKTSLVGDFTGPENPSGSGSYPPDGIVDDYDLAYISNAYGARRGDPEWSEFEIADVTGPENPPNSRWYPPDGVIDVYDLAAFGKNYGKHD